MSFIIKNVIHFIIQVFQEKSTVMPFREKGKYLVNFKIQVKFQLKPEIVGWYFSEFHFVTKVE